MNHGAIVNREKALDRYYKNPVICKYCKKVLVVGKNEKPSQVRAKNFCNSTCSATYNNKNRKRKPQSTVINCIRCNKGVVIYRNKSGSFKKRKYCDECLSFKRATKNGAKDYIGNLTKKEVFDRYDRYYIGRNSIRRHAFSVFNKSDKDKKCAVCGYSRHFEVSHVKPVSEFDDNSLVSDINSVDNLIALCPTHHWEFDNGFLDDLKASK